MKPRLFVFIACVLLLLASREQPWGDARVVYETTTSLVERGKLDVNLGGPPQFYAIREGKKYGVFPLGNVVAMVPSYLAWKALRAIPHPASIDENIYRLACHLTPSALIALVCVLFFGLAKREGASERTALFMSLLLAFGTILFVYARIPFSEALQALALTWMIERTLALGDELDRTGALLLGVACGVLFNTKLVYAGAIATVPVYLFVRHRRRLVELLINLVLAGIPLCAFVGLALAHNYLKTGTLHDTGYAIPNGVFSGDAYAALTGYFLSTGKSVFLYSPPLVLGAIAFPSYWRRHRAHAAYLLAVTAVVTLMNAKFRYWHADYCWGPRLLVPLTAVWLVPAALWIEDALARGRARLRALALGALVGISLWVQVLGASLYWDHYIRIAIAVKDQTGAAGWYTEDLHHCHFIPQFSPLVGHTWMLRHILHRDADPMLDAPWKRVHPGKVVLTGELGGARFDFWPLDWVGKREGRAWMGAYALLMLGGAIGAGVGLFRRKNGPEEGAERPFRIAGLPPR